MQVQNVNNSPNFGAKIVIGDDRVQKFIKSSFIAKRKEMHNLLDTFNSVNKDSIVTVNIRNLNGSDHLYARNGVTGQSASEPLKGGADKIDLDSRNAFYNLVKGLLKNKDFWNKIGSGDAEMASLEPAISHDVFKLNK